MTPLIGQGLGLLHSGNDLLIHIAGSSIPSFGDIWSTLTGRLNSTNERCPQSHLLRTSAR